MSKEKLETILKAIDRAQSFIDKDLDTVHPNARPGFYAARNEAKEKMKSLIEEFSQECQAHWGAIFVGGGQVDNYIELAQKEGDLIVVDASALYRQIAQEVEETMGDTRVFGPSQMAVLLSAVRSIGVELDVVAMDTVKYMGDEALHGTDAVVAHVRKTIRASLEDSFNILFLRKQIIDAAIKGRYTSSIVPIAVTGISGTDEQEGLSAMFRHNISIRPNKKMSTDYVIDTFKRLQKEFQQSAQ